MLILVLISFSFSSFSIHADVIFLAQIMYDHPSFIRWWFQTAPSTDRLTGNSSHSLLFFVFLTGGSRQILLGGGGSV